MSLLVLSTEILLLIFSHDFLSPSDLYHIIQTCRRTYDIGIVSLYRKVCISARPNHFIPGKYIVTNLKALSEGVHQQPALASFVHSAELYWETDCPGRTNKLLALLSKFTSIKSLDLACAYGTCSTSMLVRNIAAFKSLSNLRQMTLTAHHTTMDMDDLATLLRSIPNLDAFCLKQFDGFNSPSSSCGPPSKLMEIEFLDAVQLPVGGAMEWFLAGQPALRTLTWTIAMNVQPFKNWSVALVDRALSPLKPHLVNLCLAIVGSHCNQWLECRIQLDCSEFVMLESLEVHEHFIFGTTSIPGSAPGDCRVEKYHRKDLSARLPSSLETLTINFHTGSKILEKAIKHEKSEDYSWILALARFKGKRFEKLTRLNIVEIANSNAHRANSQTPGIAAVEWEYPLDVEKAFRSAGIALQVMLRPQHQVRR
ncbi:hypothetical protein BKA65DRAFT_487640 [Rhexocercosporidium sp. MPI-PUGE-AT-0058]|nr:hypothetical protein BKA65DRAFT_487640 [Rhexocercosporidium sp. MPI-PUGE-AT-0058]